MIKPRLPHPWSAIILAQELSRGNFFRCQIYQPNAEIINENVKEADRILRPHQMRLTRKIYDWGMS